MRVLLTGGSGMLGRSFARSWQSARPDDELVVSTRAIVDLGDQSATRDYVAEVSPDAIVHAAARVGGIQAKLSEPAGFLLDNLMLDSNVLAAAIGAEVPELLYVGSAAVYPAVTDQPISESALLTGPLESANEGYALAKIAAGKVCEYVSRQYGFAYRTVAPSNLYGPHEDYSVNGAHLIAAAIAKLHAARVSGAPTVEIWGDGTARREFTYVDDLTRWLAGQVGRLSEWPPILNVGAGTDHSIAEYYESAKKVVGFTGRFEFDTTKPAGVPQRLLDSSAARALGWSPSTSIEQGMTESYAQFMRDTQFTRDTAEWKAS